MIFDDPDDDGDWSLIIIAFLLALLCGAFVFAAGCASTPAPEPKGPTPDGWPATLCIHEPIRIYPGSCGNRHMDGAIPCVVCEGADGCMPNAHTYCVARGSSCDDRLCSR